MYDRSLGFIALADEESAYGTAGSTLVYQHGISVSPTYNENRQTPPVLGSVSADTGIRLSSHFTGTVNIGHTSEDDDIGILYGHMGSYSSPTYTFGGTPVYDSLTLFYDLNGVEYDVVGGVVRSVTWNLNNNDFSTIAIDMIGRAPTKYGGASRSPSVPPATEITTPTDLTTFTIGGDSVTTLTTATITYTRQVTGMERQRLGASNLPQPVIHSRPTVEATFTLELDDDSIAYVDDLLADTAGVSVVLGDFTLGGMKVMGDLPQLERGLGNLSLRMMGTSLTVDTD